MKRKAIVLANQCRELMQENARLKSEVERVQAQSDFYRNKLMNETAYTANVQLLDQVKHLEAQVERLNTIIISGGAVIPDAKPYCESE